MEEYYGARGVDGWNSPIWEKEINNHDVSKLAIFQYFLLCLLELLLNICPDFSRISVFYFYFCVSFRVL